MVGGNDKTDDLPISCCFVETCCGLAYAWKRQQYVFYFFKFNSIAPQLYLAVTSSDEDNFTVAPLSHQIASAVDPFLNTFE